MPIPFDELPLTDARFLAAIGKVLPKDYLDQLRARPNSGYELFIALSKLGQRLALANNRVLAGSYALHAEGGALSAGVVTIRRDSDDSGDFVIKSGTIVGTRHGQNYRTTRDVSLTGTDIAVDVEVVAVAPGWEWDVPGARLTAGGLPMAGWVDRVVSPFTDPQYADTTLAVTNENDITGGRAPMLDLVAADRGLTRAVGESDASLGLRARRLPDTVSPGAILRVLHELLDPFGIVWNFIETFEHGYQECYDAPSPNPLTPSYDGGVPPTNPDYSDETFVYDDPRLPDSTFRNRTMDRAEYRAAFVVVLDRSTTLRDTGIAYDDFGINPADFHPLAGHPFRQTPAYDLNSGMSPEVVYGGAYDGFDVDRVALFAAVALSIQKIRAAGVSAVVDTVRFE